MLVGLQLPADRGKVQRRVDRLAGPARLKPPPVALPPPGALKDRRVKPTYPDVAGGQVDPEKLRNTMDLPSQQLLMRLWAQQIEGLSILLHRVTGHDILTGSHSPRLFTHGLSLQPWSPRR